VKWGFFQQLHAISPHFPSYVSALSDARTVQIAWNEYCQRAFDKAVRRKPLAFAAEASLWGLHVGGRGTRLR